MGKTTCQTQQVRGPQTRALGAQKQTTRRPLPNCKHPVGPTCAAQRQQQPAQPASAPRKPGGGAGWRAGTARPPGRKARAAGRWRSAQQAGAQANEKNFRAGRAHAQGGAIAANRSHLGSTALWHAAPQHLLQDTTASETRAAQAAKARATCLHRDALVGAEAGAQRTQQAQRLALVRPCAAPVNHAGAQALGL